jgi:hypothetical protein
MRRYLWHAFPGRALTEQEDIISQTSDQWVEGAHKRGSEEKGFNMIQHWQGIRDADF